jgi:hypothetical protein
LIVAERLLGDARKEAWRNTPTLDENDSTIRAGGRSRRIRRVIAMTIEISKMFPTDRESPVAELNVRHDGVVDIPAELFRRDGRLLIALFARSGRVQGEYPVDEFVEAIEAGKSALDL